MRSVQRIDGLAIDYLKLKAILVNSLLRHYKGNASREAVVATVNELTVRELGVLARAFLRVSR